jgi:hypothetical protein
MDEPTAYRSELVCGTCGTSPTTPDAEAAARLTWSHGIENARPQLTCDSCSRTYLRSIEGKLDSAWW